jgi:hypothetical protein
MYASNLILTNVSIGNAMDFAMDFSNVSKRNLLAGEADQILLTQNEINF